MNIAASIVHDLIARRGIIAKPCPFCGADPGLATRRNGVGPFLVGCTEEDCPVQPQTSDMDLSVAWAKWNRRP